MEKKGRLNVAHWKTLRHASASPALQYRLWFQSVTRPNVSGGVFTRTGLRLIVMKGTVTTSPAQISTYRLLSEDIPFSECASS